MTEELAKLETHSLLLEDRSRLRLTGVTDVDSFDEETITDPQEFIDYVKPLVIGIINPHYAGGLPKHMKIPKDA